MTKAKRKRKKKEKKKEKKERKKERKKRKKKMDMKFGAWNVRILYRAGTLGLVASEIDKYRMDLVEVQEVRWEGSGTLESGSYTLFYGEGNANHQPGPGFFVHGRIRSSVKKVTVFQGVI